MQQCLEDDDDDDDNDDNGDKVRVAQTDKLQTACVTQNSTSSTNLIGWMHNQL